MPHKRPIHKARRTIDWRAVEADYRAGLAVRVIARRHGVNPSTVHRRARRYEWRRNEAATPSRPAERRAQAAPPPLGLPSPTFLRPPTCLRRSEAPASRRQERASRRRERSSGFAQAGAPADEIARLRRLAARLRQRLERLIDGESDDDVLLGGRESPASLLLKLCQITEKIIAIERRLVGADAPSPKQLSEQDREILNRFKRRYGVG